MRKLLIVLVILLLPACAFADGPDGFTAELLNMTDMEFAAVCETALAGTKLSGSVVAVREDGEFALVRDEYDAFAVMFRTDGLMMLCHFVPAGGALVLDWHNDLLLSSYQDIALNMEGASWSGGSIPRLESIFGKLYLRIDQGDGTRLTLIASGFMQYEAWRVTEMILYASADGESYRAALHLHKDCLADDIYLATCEPGDWRRGEREEDYYGW